jgi:hypothetical protein
MLLSARLLNNVTDVNHFDSVMAQEMNQGGQTQVYFQLIDLSQDCERSPRGRRYVPGAGAMLSVIVQHLDNAKKLVKTATQPFPTTDPSIWSFVINSTDTSVRGTVDLVLTLSEGTVVRNCRLQGALRVTPIVPVELYPNTSGNIWPSF